MKVISGGQNGADQAGLRAAKKAGLKTGGSLPLDCITLDGQRFDLIAEYDMEVMTKKGYPIRTEANVKNSDGTIRFAKTFSSAGEKCTLKAIKWYNRPYLDIDIKNPKPKEVTLAWLRDNNIKVLNVAGNSEQTAPGIGDFVYEYLLEVFKEIES